MNVTGLVLWVIYDHPEDYPEHFVVRTQTVEADGHISIGMPILCDTLAAAHAALPGGLFNLGRQPEDVPCIAEVWV